MKNIQDLQQEMKIRVQKRKQNQKKTREPFVPITKVYKSEHASYSHAKMRCNNSNAHDYAYYGGRNIKFLYKNFKQFIKDLGTKPSDLTSSGKRRMYTLERKNTNGNYEPGNCRWATWSEQRINRRIP